MQIVVLSSTSSIWYNSVACESRWDVCHLDTLPTGAILGFHYADFTPLCTPSPYPWAFGSQAGCSQSEGRTRRGWNIYYIIVSKTSGQEKPVQQATDDVSFCLLFIMKCEWCRTNDPTVHSCAMMLLSIVSCFILINFKFFPSCALVFPSQVEVQIRCLIPPKQHQTMGKAQIQLI